ncbi:MAG: DUF456 domain-containing protein [Candidatus Hydrogenedentes bacterium]|nr:DUF456 domain-containing protein [Candidatus Hydrogenedentota bacterium]
MDTFLAIAGWSVFVLVVLAGLVLNLVGILGNWVILGAALVALWQTGNLGFWTIAGAVLLAVVGEVLEFLMAGFGTKFFGGSKGAMVAALVGCLTGAVLGTPVMPVIGTLAGACLGALAGAALYEHLKHEKEIKDALWAGLGAGLGTIGGRVAKVGCGMAIVGVVLVAVFTAK